MCPSRASSRKQMRQRLKSRIKPRGRPHLKQRRTVRLENFGLRAALTTIDFFAIDTCAVKEFWRPGTPPFGSRVRSAPSVPRFSQFPSICSGLAKKQNPLRGHDTIGETALEVNVPCEPSYAGTHRAVLDIRSILNEGSNGFRKGGQHAYGTDSRVCVDTSTTVFRGSIAKTATPDAPAQTP